ncbi:MAG: Transcriptional regulator PadR-like family [Thermoplasmata archaeon]|jgi:DNA-binding PadR family transcriptional regulator|nr:Transcriptional regulator PadR-like family [Thermoplasmata archaeon]
MVATSGSDLRILRLLRAQPMHAYAVAARLAQEGETADRATVYRRLDRLERAGLLASSDAPGQGPRRRVYRVAPAGTRALHDELRGALDRLMAAYHDATRRRSGGGSRMPEGPVAMVSGSRVGSLELRILGHYAAARPRQTFLVVPPGTALPGRAPPGLVVMEGAWSALPLRDAHARLLFVNELPPTRALPRAAREWARVLAPGGTLHAIAPAPLPRGLDPFVDFLADAQAQLFPDVAEAPASETVTKALRAAFRDVAEKREGPQRVWTARAKVT